LTPSEVVRFEVSRSAGPGKRSFSPDPRNLDPLKAQSEYETPAYWLVSTPTWAGADRLTIVERVNLNKDATLPFGYVHQLGLFDKTPVLFYDADFHNGVGEFCSKIEPLLKRLSKVGIETIATSLTP